jgi:predicted glycosyltransferase
MRNVVHKPNHRLDLIIYAHDGRGQGHVSRSIAVASALRRLYPDLKIMMITGERGTEELIGAIDLEWIKLPSYVKKIVGGKTKSVVGPTNLKNSYIVASRTRLIKAVMQEYLPRCVLVDHESRGKRNELIPAIENGRDVKWFLGIRGIMGRVGDFWNPQAVAIYQKYYSGMLWYGDANILGRSTQDAVAAYYDDTPREMGYVSRLIEMQHWTATVPIEANFFAGTIAISLQTKNGMNLLAKIRAALETIGDRYGRWQLFLKEGGEIFADLPICDVQKPGQHYLHALAHSKVALIYGGYNSLTDILATRKPSVVLLRALDDGEQQEHVTRLAMGQEAQLAVIDENKIDVDTISNALEKLLAAPPPICTGIQLNGAENAAHFIAQQLR